MVTSTEDGASINFDAGWHGASLPLKDVRRPIADRNSSATPAVDGRGAHRDTAPSLTSGAHLRSMGNILDLDVGSLGGDSFSVGDQVCVYVCVFREWRLLFLTEVVAVLLSLVVVVMVLVLMMMVSTVLYESQTTSLSSVGPIDLMRYTTTRTTVSPPLPLFPRSNSETSWLCERVPHRHTTGSYAQRTRAART